MDKIAPQWTQMLDAIVTTFLNCWALASCEFKVTTSVTAKNNPNLVLQVLLEDELVSPYTEGTNLGLLET